jgi:hypothetical protein
MSRLLIVTLLVCSFTTCALPVEDAKDTTEDLDSGYGGHSAEEAVYIRSDEDKKEEERLLAEVPEIEALLQAGLPLPEEEGYTDLSEYQRYRRTRKEPGVLLGRMTVSEGTSIMPLHPSWELDMQGILQVTRTNQRSGEQLYDALGRHSPHVAKIRKYTRPRQRWTSTLPAKGSDLPELWIECTRWDEDDKGNRQGHPAGCNGVWFNGVKNWLVVREYAKELVQLNDPPTPVQGNPKAWGGKMDIWAFLQKRPNMCWLESGDTRNYFFGDKDDPENQCKQVPPELLQDSKTISARIIQRDIRRRTHARYKRRP